MFIGGPLAPGAWAETTLEQAKATAARASIAIRHQQDIFEARSGGKPLVLLLWESEVSMQWPTGRAGSVNSHGSTTKKHSASIMAAERPENADSDLIRRMLDDTVWNLGIGTAVGVVLGAVLLPRGENARCDCFDLRSDTADAHIRPSEHTKRRKLL
jgi:hypothetical protein